MALENVIHELPSLGNVLQPVVNNGKHYTTARYLLQQLVSGTRNIEYQPTEQEKKFEGEPRANTATQRHLNYMAGRTPRAKSDAVTGQGQQRVNKTSTDDLPRDLSRVGDRQNCRIHRPKPS